MCWRTGNSQATPSGVIYATLALGSNLGDKFQNIERALRLLGQFNKRQNQSEGHDRRSENNNSINPNKLWMKDVPPELEGTLELVETSFLYETAPMYVTTQPTFINCACLVRRPHVHRKCDRTNSYLMLNFSPFIHTDQNDSIPFFSAQTMQEDRKYRREGT